MGITLEIKITEFFRRRIKDFVEDFYAQDDNFQKFVKVLIILLVPILLPFYLVYNFLKNFRKKCKSLEKIGLHILFFLLKIFCSVLFFPILELSSEIFVIILLFSQEYSHLVLFKLEQSLVWIYVKTKKYFKTLQFFIVQVGLTTVDIFTDVVQGIKYIMYVLTYIVLWARSCIRK